MASDKHAEFQFYINRQGPRGRQGDKGDKGFSPSISINTDTDKEFTLDIHNEFNTFTTPNLKEGLIPEDRGGTYVRKDTETGKEFFGEADKATVSNFGEVRFASDDEVKTRTEGLVIDAGNVEDIVQENLTPTQETVQEQGIRLLTAEGAVERAEQDITQLQNSLGKVKTDVETNKSSITVLNSKVASITKDVSGLDTSVFALESDLNKVKADVKTNHDEINDNIVNIDALESKVDGMQNVINQHSTDVENLKTNKQNKLTAGNNITIDDNNVISASGGGGGDVTASGNNAFTGNNSFSLQRNNATRVTLDLGGYKTAYIANDSDSTLQIGGQDNNNDNIYSGIRINPETNYGYRTMSFSNGVNDYVDVKLTTRKEYYSDSKKIFLDMQGGSSDTQSMIGGWNSFQAGTYNGYDATDVGNYKMKAGMDIYNYQVGLKPDYSSYPNAGLIVESDSCKFVKNDGTEVDMLAGGNAANKDLSNVSTTATTKMAHSAMPSTRNKNLTLGASGTEYTAPADGYVTFCKKAGLGNNFSYAHLYTIASGYLGSTATGYSTTSGELHCNIPVYKGQKFKATYNASGDTIAFRFIYATGVPS